MVAAVVFYSAGEAALDSEVRRNDRVEEQWRPCIIFKQKAYRAGRHERGYTSMLCHAFFDKNLWLR